MTYLMTAILARLAAEEAIQPALGALDGLADFLDGGVDRAGAGGAILGGGALGERQLERAGAAGAAQAARQVDRDHLDALGPRELERLGRERGHHLAPDRHRGAAAGEARGAVVVVADPDDAQAVAGEVGEPGV